VQQQQIDTALKTWTNLKQREEAHNQASETADVLTGLWSNPPATRCSTDSRQFRRLVSLYSANSSNARMRWLRQQLNKRPASLVEINLIGSIPAVGGLLGVGLLIFLVGERLVKGKNLYYQNGDIAWSTPWNGETVWQVFILGFFLMGQIPVPLAFSSSSNQLDRVCDSGVLPPSYLLLALGALLVVYLSIKSFYRRRLVSLQLAR